MRRARSVSRKITDAMRCLFTPLSRSHASELLDDSGLDPDELAANLRDIRRVNRFFGGTSTIMRYVPGLIALVPPQRTVSILDLATGSADIPITLSAWGKSNGRSLQITASDSSQEILDIAANHVSGKADVTLSLYDARDVAAPDAGFDIVLCSLALHHFAPDDAVRVLREMRRLARIGWIVNDLQRSRLGYLAAWVAAHFTTRNRLTRHDAPLSVLRAYTPGELRDLVVQAGVGPAMVRSHAWFRMAAVGQIEQPHG